MRFLFLLQLPGAVFERLGKATGQGSRGLAFLVSIVCRRGEQTRLGHPGPVETRDLRPCYPSFAGVLVAAKWGRQAEALTYLSKFKPSTKLIRSSNSSSSNLSFSSGSIQSAASCQDAEQLQGHLRSHRPKRFCTLRLTRIISGSEVYRHACIITYIHTYIHSFIHTFIHAFIHTYIHTYLPTYIHTYIHTKNIQMRTPIHYISIIYLSIYVSIYLLLWLIRYLKALLTCVYCMIYIYIYTYTYVQLHINIHIYIYIYISYIYIYTYSLSVCIRVYLFVFMSISIHSMTHSLAHPFSLPA